jgi:hypothetical protein
VRYQCVSVHNLLSNWRSISLVQNDRTPGSKVNINPYVSQQYLPAAKRRLHQIVSARRHSREPSFTRSVGSDPSNGLPINRRCCRLTIRRSLRTRHDHRPIRRDSDSSARSPPQNVGFHRIRLPHGQRAPGPIALIPRARCVAARYYVLRRTLEKTVIGAGP